MSLNGWIIFLALLTVFICTFFNAFGIGVTKYASAAQRSTIDSARTALIWIVSLALGLEKFVAWQVPGFVMLVIGTLIYNEIVVIPYFGFNEWT